MNVLSNIEPRSVFKYFEEICEIPHGSGNTKAISDYLTYFAKTQGLKYRQDSVNNVIIWKDASPGYQNAPIVMLQSHIDMVCEKETGYDIDMSTSALELFVDGDLIGAKRTSLGADNGIAVAMCLAILAADNIPHGPLECIFTADEEVGMLGAMALDVSDLKAHYLLNLDSEVEGVLTVSCAGSSRVVCSFPVRRDRFLGEVAILRVSGLIGGHSGLEIHKGRINANSLLGRVLYELSQVCELRIFALEGGSKDNAIPSEANAILSIDKLQTASDIITRLNETLRNEYRATDGNVQLSLQPTEISVYPFDRVNSEHIISFLFCAPNGVQHMSPDVPGLVQTSLNLGQVHTQENTVVCRFMVRSNIDSQKNEIIAKVRALAESLGGVVEIPTSSSAWEYKQASPLRDTVIKAFRSVYGEEPQIAAMHGGLECGVLSGKIPQLDCISYGPNLTGIHTPEERLHIASTKRVWQLTLEILKHLK